MQHDLSELDRVIAEVARQRQEQAQYREEEIQDRKANEARVTEELQSFVSTLKSIADAGYSFGGDLPDVSVEDCWLQRWGTHLVRADRYGEISIKKNGKHYKVHAESGTRTDRTGVDPGLPDWILHPDLHFDDKVDPDELVDAALKAVVALGHVIERTKPNIHVVNP